MKSTPLHLGTDVSAYEDLERFSTRRNLQVDRESQPEQSAARPPSAFTLRACVNADCKYFEHLLQHC